MPQPKSPHHALAWRRPRGVSFPRLIEQAIARLQGAIEQPNSAIHRALAAVVPVFRADGQTRRRRLRRDGAQNLVTLLSALLANADLQRGLVAAPVADGGRWQRRTWADMDWRAFGPVVPEERSARRTERHARTAIDAGWIRVMPWKTTNADGEWRSLPGLKFVTDKLWRLLGLFEQVRAARKHRDRQRGQDRVRQLIQPAGGPPALAEGRGLPLPAARSQAASHEPRPPPSHAGPAVVGDVARAEIAKLKKRFGMA